MMRNMNVKVIFPIKTASVTFRTKSRKCFIKAYFHKLWRNFG